MRDFAIGGAAMLAFCFATSPQLRSVWTRLTTPAATLAAREASVYYPGCAAARAAGAAPIYAGRPGYRPGMDGDSDGIACEPYHGN